MKISLCLIVKNEEEVLQRCLESFKPLYDELIIIDTGSNDNTKKIAKNFTDKVFDFPWCDDFSKARNFSFEHASGDWIVWCDADDIIENPEWLKERLLKEKNDGVYVTYQFGPDVVHRRLIAIKKNSAIWKGEVHEYLDLKGVTSYYKDLRYIHHRSYKRGEQSNRNLNILLKAEKTPRNLFYLGREYFDHKLYDEAINVYQQYLTVSDWDKEKQQAWYEIARCYKELNDKKLCKLYCFQSLSMNDDFIDPWIMLCQLAYENKQWHKLKKMSMCAITCEEYDAIFNYKSHKTWVPYDYLSLAYWNLGEYAKGYEALLKVLYYNNEKRLLDNKKHFENKLRGFKHGL